MTDCFSSTGSMLGDVVNNLRKTQFRLASSFCSLSLMDIVGSLDRAFMLAQFRLTVTCHTICSGFHDCGLNGRELKRVRSPQLVRRPLVKTFSTYKAFRELFECPRSVHCHWSYKHGQGQASQRAGCLVSASTSRRSLDSDHFKSNSALCAAISIASR